MVVWLCLCGRRGFVTGFPLVKMVMCLRKIEEFFVVLKNNLITRIRLCFPLIWMTALKAEHKLCVQEWRHLKYIIIMFGYIRIFFLISAGYKCFLWGHWYPCFGLLVMSAPGSKAKVDPSFACFVACVWWIPNKKNLGFKSEKENFYSPQRF